MARVFAQHADAGKYHLETRYGGIEPLPWEWFVILKPDKTVFSGDSKTLEGAKTSAGSAVGLGVAQWKDIGPAIELPD
jgi:hypothetical protein